MKSDGCIWPSYPLGTGHLVVSASICTFLRAERTPGLDTPESRRKSIRTSGECWDVGGGFESRFHDGVDVRLGPSLIAI